MMIRRDLFGDIMSRSFRSLYDKFISTIRNVKERFTTTRAEGRIEMPEEVPRAVRIPVYEVPVVPALERPIVLTPWTTIAYLDSTSNRFRDSKTGLFLMGQEYRAKQSDWRKIMLDGIVSLKHPYLDADQRLNLIGKIERLREGDLSAEDKDRAIRVLIGSP